MIVRSTKRIINEITINISEVNERVAELLGISFSRILRVDEKDVGSKRYVVFQCRFSKINELKYPAIFDCYIEKDRLFEIMTSEYQGQITFITPINEMITVEKVRTFRLDDGHWKEDQ